MTRSSSKASAFTRLMPRGVFGALILCGVGVLSAQATDCWVNAGPNPLACNVLNPNPTPYFPYDCVYYVLINDSVPSIALGSPGFTYYSTVNAECRKQFGNWYVNEIGTGMCLQAPGSATSAFTPGNQTPSGTPDCIGGGTD